jgi:hypothetical protein
VGWDLKKVEIKFENIDISILFILNTYYRLYKTSYHTDDVKQIIVLSAEAEPTKTKSSTSINTSKHR